MKIAWVWQEPADRFVRLEDLTPEEILLRSILAHDYGTDLERTWEECMRRVAEEAMQRRETDQESGPEHSENSEEQY